MNTKNATMLADRLTSDEQFLKDLEAHSGSPEATREYLKSEGYEFTETELRAALQDKQELYSKASLSNVEMEGVSGGINPFSVIQGGAVVAKGLADFVNDARKNGERLDVAFENKRQELKDKAWNFVKKIF